ncbi:unnamed protein product [Calicophoron daubneyi]|uniref:Centrosomal protein of 135 kDa n=1 Tax=Calicophoron daubneyi TaxID=300641 RepID=A0AAV2TMV6_CALDB
MTPVSSSCCANVEYERLIAELNNEIERLACQNRCLSENLSRTEDKVSLKTSKERDLEKHNKSLMDELCQLNKELVSLRADFRSRCDALEVETVRLRSQLADTVRERDEFAQQRHKFEREKNRLERTLAESKQQHLSADGDTRNMRTLLIRLEEDKKRLMQRIEKLTANERALVLELERLRRRGGVSMGKGNGISRLEEHLSGIEADRDYWRNQVELLQQMIANPSFGVRSGSAGRSLSVKLKSKPPIGQSPIKPSVKSKDPVIQKLENELRDIRADRDHLRQELDRSGRSRRSSPSPPTRSRSLNRIQAPQSESDANRDRQWCRGNEYWASQMTSIGMRPNPTASPRELTETGLHSSSLGLSQTKTISNTRGDLAELNRLRQERDELRDLLNKLEKRVQEIQTNVHTLTMERDQVNKLYNDARCEIHRLHQDLYALHENGDRSCQTTQSALRRAEAERDRALVDLSRVTAERDGLITKYKSANDNYKADKLRLTKQLDHLERCLHQISAERDEAMRRSDEQRQRLNELRANQKQLEEDVIAKQETKATDESTQLRNELDAQFRISAEKAEEAVRMSEQIHVMEMEIRGMEERVNECEKRLRHEREENSSLHSQIGQLQEENKCVQYELEKSSAEQADMLRQQRQIDKRIQTMTADCDRLVKQLTEANDQNKRLTERLSQLEQECAENMKRYQIEKTANEKLQEKIDAINYAKNTAERRNTWYDQQLAEAQSALARSEQQLSVEKDQNKWMSETNEKLIEDNKTLRATVELANKDKVHLESCIEDLTAAHRQAARDRDEMAQRCKALNDQLSDLETGLKQADIDMKRGAEALRAERAAVADLQQQLELHKRRIEVSEHDALDANNRHRETEDQLHKAETRVGQLERELRVEQNDYAQLRARYEALDEEKQNLEIGLHEAAQRLSHAEVDLSSRTREVSELRKVNEECSRALSKTQEALSVRNTELANSRNEQAAMQASLTEVRSLLEAQEREASRLREELSKMARESQKIQTELHDTADEREELRQRAKDYLTEIARQERALSEREGECNKLADQIRAANGEAEAWRARWEATENKLTAIRAEVEEREAEIAAERERADSREREVSHLRANLNTAELQSTSASRAAAEATEQLQVARAEMETLTSEVARLRDNLNRTESEKTNAQREATGHRLDGNQLRAQLDDLEIESEQLREQLEKERITVSTLQSMLQSLKQKEQGSSAEIQEKNVELAALKERVAATEERSESAQREADRLRERLVESEREVNRLSRNLSAERFEKERALSELRLNSLPAGYRPSGYTSLGSGLYHSSTLPRDRPSYREDY